PLTLPARPQTAPTSLAPRSLPAALPTFRRARGHAAGCGGKLRLRARSVRSPARLPARLDVVPRDQYGLDRDARGRARIDREEQRDRKSTRLNSSHVAIAYAVFGLNKESA